MRLFWCMLLLTFATASNAEIVSPYETAKHAVSPTAIDSLVQAKLQQNGIQSANPITDEVFVRRLFIDVTGTLPPAQVVRKFLKNKSPLKRQKLIELLLANENFNHYWSLKWGDLLRIKAEFPINLWPNGVQAYHQWVHHSLENNMPYDAFVRALLTSSGSNFRVPPVNFYRAIEGTEPKTIAAAVALTFMGTRFEALSAKQQQDLTRIFSRVAYKKTVEWKEEIVFPDPAQIAPMDVTFPDGSQGHVKSGEDARVAFANWLIRDDNPWFTEIIVNRVWFWLMGRGIVHEPDNLKADAENVNPELMAYLQQELVNSKYDLRHLFRLILNSQTYQQSAIPQSDHPQAEALFAHYKVRRLDAEVLIDALNFVSGSGEYYQSPVPEPFTFVPETNKSIQLADGSISSQFLDKFGRPGRDTGLELERNNHASTDQAMYLLNSSAVHDKLSKSGRLNQLFKRAKWQPEPSTKALYLMLLSRAPTTRELDTAKAYFSDAKGKKRKQGLEDLTWALINSKEFLFRH